MEREYNLFECFPDDSVMWRGHVLGLQNACLKLQEIARATTNQCIAIYLPTHEIVARLNVSPSCSVIRKPLVFQIAYDERLAIARTELLRLRGYDVVSVIGNEAAKVALSLPQHCDLFVVGHAAPKKDREEMIGWLKVNYPHVRVLALNLPDVLELAGADYNIRLNGAEIWLSMAARALGGPQYGGARPKT